MIKVSRNEIKYRSISKRLKFKSLRFLNRNGKVKSFAILNAISVIYTILYYNIEPGTILSQLYAMGTLNKYLLTI